MDTSAWSGKFGPMPFDTGAIAKGATPEALLRRAHELGQWADSAFYDAMAARRALNRSMPYRSAKEEVDEKRFLAGALDSSLSGKQNPMHVNTDDFKKVLDIIKGGSEAHAWARSGDTTADSNSLPVKIFGGPQADTVEIGVNLDSATLMKLAEQMRQIHDTIYENSSRQPSRDTSHATFKIDPKMAELLKKAFPMPQNTCNKSPDETKDPHDSILPILRQIDISRIDSLRKSEEETQHAMVFVLFPNIKVLGRPVSHCNSAKSIFIIPGPGGPEGLEMRSLLTASLGASDTAINTLVKKISWMKQTFSSERQISQSAHGIDFGAKNLKPIDHFPPREVAKFSDLTGNGRGLQRSGSGAGSGSGQDDNGGIGASLAKGFKGQEGVKITSNGKKAQWFYIPSWYMLGPFSNEKRRNIAKPFAPEYGIDLDGVYKGNNGRTIRWQYASFADCTIVPPGLDEYNICYAFTRIWCETAMNMWVAIGSDDRSDIWVNEKPVWQSGSMEKALTLDEGFRRVHFNAGDNRILLRLENGWLGGAFSLLLSAG